MKIFYFYLILVMQNIFAYDLNIIIFENQYLESKENFSQIVINKQKNKLIENNLLPISNKFLLKIIEKLGSDKVLLSGKLSLYKSSSEFDLDLHHRNININGLISFKQEKYVDCKFQLNIIKDSIYSFPINQKIRLKEELLNYVDNNLIGILIFIEK